MMMDFSLLPPLLAWPPKHIRICVFPEALHDNPSLCGYRILDEAFDEMIILHLILAVVPLAWALGPIGLLPYKLQKDCYVDCATEGLGVRADDS